MTELIALFWIADVMDLQFMEMFDTVYALNEMFWFWGWLMIISINQDRRR
jgi:hypothetical protein